MLLEYFYWNANAFCKLFMTNNHSSGDFLEIWKENTGISMDGYCCIDSMSVAADMLLPSKQSSAATTPRKRASTVANQKAKKKKQLDEIDALIEEKEFGKA